MFKKFGLPTIITVIAALLIYYVMLPPIKPH